MAILDSYAACPCGSGNKFKWCCQPIYDDIVKSFRLDSEGQHDVALKLMEDVVAKHPDNPEAWGRQAQLLFQQGKHELGEAALQKAFEKNPRYPFGHYLQGRVLHAEGEIAGSLIMFRRAVAYYHPDSKPVLSELHGLICDCELKLNHPLAARAALELAIRFEPASEELRKAREQVFGEGTPFPAAARQEYKYLPLPTSAPPELRAGWEKALAGTDKLVDAVEAFRKLTEQHPEVAEGWYNLALSWAWLGNCVAAVDAIDKYVELETDDDKASQAWTMAEILLCGQGAEDRADIVENVALFILKSSDAVMRYLDELQKERRLLGAQVAEQDQVLTALVMEKPAIALAGQRNPRLGGSLMLVGNLFTLRNTWKESLDKVVAEASQALGATVGENRLTRAPARFPDLFSEGMVFPVGATTEMQAQSTMREGFERYFEEIWLQRPLKSLGGVTPVDAGGHRVLKRKLRGILQFYQECAGLNRLPYDFDRLRRKLGLLGSATIAAGTGPVDISSLGTAELAQLAVSELSVDQVELAFQTALHLDARELAGKFAKDLVGRPARAERPDRFAWFNHLIQLALTGSDFAAALQFVDEGEKDDCEHNEGRRRNDYELRRGQLQAKQGDFDQAKATFDRLIARMPSELRYQGSAAEALLSARQAKRALPYAEKGLAGARQQNNRDMEGYFQELVAAAQKS